MVEPTAVISVAKSALETVKKAIEIAENVKNVELRSLILDLKQNILDLKEQNISLQEEVSRFKNIELNEKSLFFENNVYWKLVGEEKQGPFCPKCWGTDKTVNPLGFDKQFYNWKCSVCKFTETHPDKPNSRKILSSSGGSWMG